MFSPEELTIIKMYFDSIKPDRNNTIRSLYEILSFIEDPEIKEVVSDIIRKVNAMTAESFDEIDFSTALDADDDIVL